MRSDAYGCVRMSPDAFRKISEKIDKIEKNATKYVFWAIAPCFPPGSGNNIIGKVIVSMISQHDQHDQHDNHAAWWSC